MKLLVDLDGPCYEWHRTARYILNEYRGTELPPIEQWWGHWDALEERIGKRNWAWLWRDGVMKHGLFRYGHMTVGTRVGLEQLVADGHTIGIATSRPAEAETDTLEWIALFFKGIPLRNGVHFTSDKGLLPGDILIDDNHAWCADWVTQAPPYHKERAALLFDRTWNIQTGYADDYLASNFGVHRVYGWKGVVEWIQKRDEAITTTNTKPSNESFRPYFPPPRGMAKPSEQPVSSPLGGWTRRTRQPSGPTSGRRS